MYEEEIQLPAYPGSEMMPGSLVYDWQMSEARSSLLDSIVWEGRYFNFRKWGLDIEALLKPPLSTEDFAMELGTHLGDYGVPMCWRGDSHAWAGILAKDLAGHYGPLSVVNFDAHHDLGYDEPLRDFKETGNVSCENWAWIGLDQGWIKDYMVVYPDWLGTKEFGSEIYKRVMESEHKDRVKWTIWKNWVRDTDDIEDVEAIYYCRSSSWTPPWLDEGFQKLTEEFTICECLDCRFDHKGPFDTCQNRHWDWEEASEIYEQRNAVIEELKGRMES